MVTSIWCHLRRHQKRKTMGPYASSPTLDAGGAAATPVKYCKGSGKVCLPLRDPCSSSTIASSPSLTCGGMTGKDDVTGPDAQGRGGGDVSPSPPPSMFSVNTPSNDVSLTDMDSPQTTQPSPSPSSSLFGTSSSLQNNATYKKFPLDICKGIDTHSTLCQPLLSSSSSTPSIVSRDPKSHHSIVHASHLPSLTLTKNPSEIDMLASPVSEKPRTLNIHSPSVFPVKFTLAPSDSLLTATQYLPSPQAQLLKAKSCASSVPSIPSKFSSRAAVSRDLLFSTSSASSSAINIPGALHPQAEPKEFSNVSNIHLLTDTSGPSPLSPYSATSASSPNILSKSLPSPVPLLIKSRPRGLLERRGSNQSLTLNISSDNDGYGVSLSPLNRREVFNVEEYLVTASRRLSRKELRKIARNSKRLSEEFWNIPMNLPDRVEVTGSATKNRYQTIIPNPKTRVRLESSHSDSAHPSFNDNLSNNYINANYVGEHGGESRAYIATQGPMEHTISDFWRMVWKERSPIIVMITKLKEKNKSKCELYLPVSVSRYGNLIVRVHKVEQHDGYQVRTLSVYPATDSDGNSLEQYCEPLTCYHCWFTSWLDHKTPQNPRPLLDMIQFVEENRCDYQSKKINGPVVVHCSAGVGRTGCFIAVSLGIQQLLKENSVDILNIVCRLRKDRGGMIQTSEQYEFIYASLAAFEKSMQSSPPLILCHSNGDEVHDDSLDCTSTHYALSAPVTKLQRKTTTAMTSPRISLSSPKSAPLPPY